MRAIRKIFLLLFIFTALISVNTVYNLLRKGVGYDIWPLVAAFIYIAIELAGLIVVIINKNRVLNGIFAIITGFATVLSGFMAFASLGAPAPALLSTFTFISLLASIFILIGYIIIGVLLFTLKPTK